MSAGVRAAGAQAEVRNQLRLMVDALQSKYSPLFEYASPEGKAIRGALAALGPVFSGGNARANERTGAMAALMARAAARRANQPPPGGPPGGGMPGPPGGGPPAMPRGPIPGGGPPGGMPPG